tara:strand:+ start:778 stop:984 length:207 start_codon:yes stop_codon:yes gene_type:complete
LEEMRIKFDLIQLNPDQNSSILHPSAPYKFAFAKSLLELVNNETTRISLKDLSEPFSRNIVKHLKQND